MIFNGNVYVHMNENVIVVDVRTEIKHLSIGIWSIFLYLKFV